MAEAGPILIVEDEADMARVLEFNLSQQGFPTQVAGTARAALDMTQRAVPRLILLDLRLPDGSGLDVLRQLRAGPSTAAIPVIVVSAIGNEETVVEALHLGAEDYVIKPVRVQELLARVATILRRQRRDVAARGMLRFADIAMDTESRQVGVGDRQIELTRSEFELLVHFVRNPGRVFTRRQLCHEALGAGGSVQERTIDAHIRTVRRKLGPAGRLLKTVWGVGYRIEEP